MPVANESAPGPASPPPELEAQAAAPLGVKRSEPAEGKGSDDKDTRPAANAAKKRAKVEDIIA
jgi:hypothetical protein